MTTMQARVGAAVADTRLHSSGEEAERRSAKLKKVTLGVVFVVGMAAGMYVGAHAAEEGFDAPWSPVAALLIAVSYVVALIGGGLLLSRRTDEVERMTQYKAAAAAGAAYMVLYPLWFVLWKGGFVPEPIHWVPFVVFWLVLAGSSIFYRYR